MKTKKKCQRVIRRMVYRSLCLTGNCFSQFEVMANEREKPNICKKKIHSIHFDGVRYEIHIQIECNAFQKHIILSRKKKERIQKRMKNVQQC